MDRGLKYLLKITVLLVFLFIGCASNNINTIDRPINGTIGQVQSELVTLTIECYDGNENSCKRMPKYINKLKQMLKESNK